MSEINTASNLGTGQGIFAQKSGVDLQFKGLVGGTNVTLTADANNITITASNDTTALNLGTGSGLFTSKSGDNLQLKSIIANAASGITVTSNTNDLTLQLNANVDAGKLGGVAASDFLRKSDNLASLASVATARTNLDVYSKAETDANTLKNNANQLPDTDSTYSLGSNSYKWANIYADNFYGRASTAGAIDSIANIGDVDVAGAVNGSVLKYNSSSGQWEIGADNNSGGGGGGSSTFVGLSDTPSNLTGDAGKFVRVNSGETALEFTSDVATQTYVNTQVANLVDSAPGTLDTLNELAAALGDDANFSTTITNSIATKLATADFNSTFDTRLSGKSTSDVSEGTNLYYTDARVDTHLNQSNPTAGYVLSWNGSDYAWVAQTGGGAGDITSVVAGTGLTGGATSGDATLNVDVGTTASKIVQLDGSGRLPAVDGSQLTGVSTTTTLAGLTDTTIGTPASGEVLYHNGSAWVDQALTTDITTEGANLYFTDARADARIGAANINALANVHTAAPTDGQVLKWDNGNSRWAPANDTDTVYSSFNTDFDTRLASKDTGAVAEGSNLYFTDARADARVQAASLTDLSNVDAVVAGDDGKVLYYDHSSTSFKWKVDASGSSYTNSDVDAHLNQSGPTSGYVLSWNGSDYAWVANGTGGITDIVNDATPQLGGTLDANGNTIDMGTNVLTDTNLGQFITAYGWGDHGSAGYLTSVPAQSFASLTGKPTTIAGYGITDALQIGTSATTALAGNTALFSGVFADLTSKPTTIAGYGITDAFSGAYADLTGKPTLFDNSAFDTRLATKDTGDLAEGSNLYYTNARADGRITAAGSANWNTAYGWGDHGAAGYQTTAGLNGAIDTHLNQSNPTSGYVLSWNGSDYAWISNSGYTNTDFDNRLATKDTGDLTEGANLYYTDARARAAISEGSAQLSYNSGTGVLTFTQGDTDTVTEGSSNLYYTSARANADFDTRLATKSTTNLAEGTNLYYTDARADARITNALIDEDNMASDSATRLPSQQSVKAYVDSQVASENELSEMNDVTISSIQNNQFLKYNASSSRWENATVTAATAAGSDTYVQFNDGGVMGGDAGIVYNKTTNDLTVSGKILYSNVYSAEGDLPSAATYHGMFAHVHGTGKGYFAHGGSWRKLLDESSSTTTDLTEGTNLYYTDARADARVNLQTGANLDLSSKDTGDLSEGSNLYYTDARADARIVAAGSANWNTAYGWGNHASAGYLTSVPAQSFASLTGKPTTIAGYGITDSLQLGTSSTTALAGDTTLFDNSAFDTRLAAKDTGDLSEGSNLYYTNARADARIAAAGLTTLSDVDTISASDDGKVLYYDHSSTAFKWKAAGGGTFGLAGNTGSHTFNTATETLTFLGTTGQINAGIAANNVTLELDPNINSIVSISFEGSTADNNETKLQAIDPTADRTINLPDADGTVALTSQLYANSDVDAHLNQSNPTNGYVLSWNGSDYAWVAQSSGGGSVAGSDTQVQFNDGGSFGGDAGFTYNKTTDALTVGSVTTTGASPQVSAAGNLGISTTASNGNITITPHSTGDIILDGQKWPQADGSANQYLKTNGSGQLSWDSLTTDDVSEGANLYYTDARADARIGAADIADLSNVNNTAPTDGQVLTWDNANSYWKPATASGGGSTGVEMFKINYATNGTLSSITDTSSGISSVSIDSASGGDITINFTGYSYPPASLTLYGYVYASNKYTMNPLNKDITLREIPGGGSTGSPTAFGSFGSIKIKAAESDSGASRSFGTTTHAWVQVVMGG